jgi:1-acyl-sn-glycerol-3-phosphate acyltransferase
VRRGEADREALTTARAVLDQDGLLIVFPEGTRVDEPDALGSPHHGAGRLAVDTGAPIVPAAILGTSHLWLGPIPKPRRVDVSFLEPISVTPETDPTELIDAAVWPAVRDEYGRLYATPGAIAAALAALGLGGLAAARLRRPPTPRLLGVVPPRRLRRRPRRRWRR